MLSLVRAHPNWPFHPQLVSNFSMEKNLAIQKQTKSIAPSFRFGYRSDEMVSHHLLVQHRGDQLGLMNDAIKHVVNCSLTFFQCRLHCSLNLLGLSSCSYLSILRFFKL